MTWPIKKLGEVADVFNGKTFPKDDYHNFGKLKTIKVKDFDEERIYFNKDENGWVNKEVEEKLILRKGDTLIINAAHSSSHVAGKIGYCDEVPPIRSFLSGEIMILRAKQGVEPLLINSLIRSHSLKRKLKDLVRGIHLYPKDVAGLKIPLPPLLIQKQIVERMDEIAEARKLNDELIQKSDELFDSLLHKELNPAGKGWKNEKLGEIAETSSGGTPLKEKIEFYESGKIPWLRSGEVSQGLIYESELFITEKGLKNSSAKIFPIDTVLMAMYGATAGQVGLLKFKASTNQAICGILPNDRFISEYLYYFLKMQTKRLIQISTGGAQPNISQQIIRNIRVPLPDLKTQKKIVTKLSAVREYKKQLLEQKLKLKELFDSVLHKSMNGGVGN